MSTKIAWTDETWNPVTGCSPVSPGCRNCYAARMAATRLKHHPRYKGLAYIGIASGRPRWMGELRLNHDIVEQPPRWKKPRMIFVCSMGDLFHEDVPFEFIGKVFATMIATDWHTFQILTKRPKRMHDFVSWFQAKTFLHLRSFRHIWFGVSVENPDYLWRIEELLKIPAAVRFVSLEPILAAIDLEQPTPSAVPNSGGVYPPWMIQQLDWVILGAESGPDYRPFDPAWALDVYEQCQRVGVAFFGKQDSGLRPGVPLLLGGREVKEWPHGR